MISPRIILYKGYLQKTKRELSVEPVFSALCQKPLLVRCHLSLRSWSRSRSRYRSYGFGNRTSRHWLPLVCGTKSLGVACKSWISVHGCGIRRIHVLTVYLAHASYWPSGTPICRRCGHFQHQLCDFLRNSGRCALGKKSVFVISHFLVSSC